MKVLKKNKGFTLVELIVVIAIIGILAAVLIPAITGYIKNARISSDEQKATAIYNVYRTYVVEIEEESYDGSFGQYYEDITGNDLPSGWKAYKNPLKFLMEFANNTDNKTIVEETTYFIFKGTYFTLIDAKTGEIIEKGIDDNSGWLQQ